MHLLDTFGVALHCITGVATREGDELPFVFAYPDGPFTNRFSYNAAAGSWIMR
jgi:hypothetical protein